MLRGAQDSTSRALRDQALLLPRASTEPVEAETSKAQDLKPFFMSAYEVRYNTTHFREKNMDVMPTEVLQVRSCCIGSVLAASCYLEAANPS